MTPAEAIAVGGVVGLPTDTVYGLAVDPFSEAAISRLFELKGRPHDRPIALLVADAISASHVVVMTDLANHIADVNWPGALTMILNPAVGFPAWVGHRTTRTVGVRVPDDPSIRELLTVTGPLAVTSANVSGFAPATTRHEAESIFGDAVDVYVDGVSGGAIASTVVDFTVDPPTVVRVGPVDPFS